MKTKLILLALIFAGFTLASFGQKTNVVVTKNKAIFCDKVSQGYFRTVARFNNLPKEAYSNQEVLCYIKNGKYYEKQTVNNSLYARGNVFMQLVDTRNGHKLYKYVSWDGNQEVNMFLVYRGDKFLLDVTPKNAASVLNFFKQ